jgi:lipopolysaccharide export LptBFGC system permease protein LptF
MSNALLIIPVLLGAFTLSAVWIWVNDRLYTRATDKPAVERQVGGSSLGNGRISRNQYLLVSGLSVLYLCFCAYELGWAHRSDGGGRVELGPLFAWGVVFYTFQVKLSRQHRVDRANTVSPQLSGPAK